MRQYNATTFMGGDILVSTYGYNRTINTFYKVTRRTEKSVWIKELKKRMTSHDGYGQNGYEAPTDKVISGEILCRICKNGTIHVSRYASALYLWDGQPKEFTSD